MTTKAKVATLSSKAYTPELILRQALEVVDDAEGVAIVVLNKDGSAESYVSRMHISQAAYLATVLTARVHRVIEGP